MQPFKKIRIVLIEPSHPGNIGAVARSMKTMGITDLVLVKPKKFPHYEATKRAAGADSVLQAARVVDDVREALKECTLVLGTSVRDREVSWPTADPKQSAEKVIGHLVDEQKQVAILFGRESSGLTNEELDLCQMQIRVPANQEYSSLNLASAVQIITYELRMSALANEKNGSTLDVASVIEQKMTPAKLRQQCATKAQLDGHMAHLFETLELLDFIKSGPPTMLMRKLTRLYNKAELTVEEIQILRGILTATQTQASQSNKLDKVVT